MIVTRPQPQCDEWAASLRQRGWDACPFPLLTLAPSPEPSKVQATFKALLAHKQLEVVRIGWAVMVVSGAAYTGLVEALGPLMHAQLLAQCAAGLRFWVTGPGSAKVLRAAGVPEHAIDCPVPAQDGLLDSQALWEKVKSQIPASQRAMGATPFQVVLVRGADEAGQYAGNPWLAEQLGREGVALHSVLAYQRLAPQWDAHRQAIWARATGAPSAEGPSIWVFSSTQGLQNLPPHDWSGASAVATHPRIAAKVRELGFSQLRLAAPTLDAVHASLKSFYD